MKTRRIKTFTLGDAIRVRRKESTLFDDAVYLEPSLVRGWHWICAKPSNERVLVSMQRIEAKS